MMFDHVDNPKEILEWLSQRNHHIPYDDLAYLLDINHDHEPSTMFDTFNEDAELFSEFSLD